MKLGKSQTATFRCAADLCCEKVEMTSLPCSCSLHTAVMWSKALPKSFFFFFLSKFLLNKKQSKEDEG